MSKIEPLENGYYHIDLNDRDWIVINRQGSIDRYSLKGGREKFETTGSYKKEDLTLPYLHRSGWEDKIHTDIEQEVSTALDAIKKFQSSPEIKQYTDLPDEIFLRFGKIPKDGKSKNYRTGETLEGTSVIEGRVIFNEGMPEIEPQNLSDPSTVISYVMEGKLPSLVKGELVGYGSDGEPLLRNVQVIKRLLLNKETGNFRLPRIKKSLPKPSTPAGGKKEY